MAFEVLVKADDEDEYDNIEEDIVIVNDKGLFDKVTTSSQQLPKTLYTEEDEII